VAIVVNFGLDVQEYLRQFSRLPLVLPTTCARCGASDCLCRHGSYGRQVCEGNAVFSIRVKRLLCRLCHRTISLLPSFCLPYRQHSTAVVEKVLSLRFLKGASWRAIGRSLGWEVPTCTTCREWVAAFARASVIYVAHLLRQLAHWQLGPGKLELALADMGAVESQPRQLVAAVPHLIAWLRGRSLGGGAGHGGWLSVLSWWGRGARLGRLV
jgi:hypothetical protein